MLLELQISDFAIIEHLRVGLQNGLTVLTGETGAGKSIIIDALGALRGDKIGVEFVRSGCTRARVEGVFSLIDHSELPDLLREYGLWDEDDEPIIVSREISAQSGRSVARINGRAVNSTILRDIGGRLIDIHGQHEGLSIFNTRMHLEMLDRYGDLVPLREQVGAFYSQLRQVRDELQELRSNEAQRTRRLEELHILLEDVQAANLQPDEEQTLVQERSVLHNAARIADLVERAYVALSTGEETGAFHQRSAIDMIATVSDDLGELARLDPSTDALAEQATDLHYRLEDLATNLRSYVDNFDFNPQRLEEIEDRLTVIRHLQRKYGASSAELFERVANAEQEIERLSHSDDYIAELEVREQDMRAELGVLALKLSQQRYATGETLAELVVETLRELALPHVRFAAHIEQVEDVQGVPLPATADQPERVCQITPLGIDRVEFLISPNPGEPLKPLVRVASGGESARVLLALKSILSRADSVPTLVFDEIDVGVGGRAGHVVGQKLWSMTDNHQVLCISHLPQVAAFADTHYAVSKVVAQSQNGEYHTHTQMRVLTIEERVDELAAMLGGTPMSDHSRASAREIIERASTVKRGANESCNDRQQ